MKNSIPYIIIGILLTIIFLQWKQCSKPAEVVVVKIDTVVKVVEIRETVHSDTLYIVSSERDTMWKESIIYVPDSTYKGLLAQYYTLGDKYFTTNYFNTTFPIKDYGYVVITDTIKENLLAGSGMQTFLKIPERTITIEKEVVLPPASEMFIGGGIGVQPTTFINSIYFGGLYKDKKRNIYGININYSPSMGLSYGVSYYAKIK